MSFVNFVERGPFHPNKKNLGTHRVHKNLTLPAPPFKKTTGKKGTQAPFKKNLDLVHYLLGKTLAWTHLAVENCRSSPEEVAAESSSISHRTGARVIL